MKRLITGLLTSFSGILLVVVGSWLLLLCFLGGCVQPEPPPQEPPQEPPGFRLNIDIGRIVDIDIAGRRYRVRVNTPNGPRLVWVPDTDIHIDIDGGLRWVN